MQYNTLKEGLDHIGKTHFNRAWSIDAINAITDDLKDTQDSVMVQITKRVYAEISPATFPPLSRIVAMAQEEQKKLNSANSPDEPKPRHVVDREFQQQFGGNHDQYVKRAWAIIAMTVDYSVGRDKLVEGLGIMDKTYPGLGCGDCQMNEIRKIQGNPAHFQEQSTSDLPL